MNKLYVQIKRFSDDEVVKELGPYETYRTAEKVCDGVGINLNHEEFYTFILETYPLNDKSD